MNRYKSLSRREYELYCDLEATETAFYKYKSRTARIAINKIRYLIIVENHRSKAEYIKEFEDEN